VLSTKIISKATLHRCEAGRAAMTPGTVLKLSLLYRLDAETAQGLYALAIGSQERGWWESSEDLLKTGVGLYIGLESVASVVQTYQPDAVPGLLQTADYARAVTKAAWPAPDEPTIAARVAIRLKRQQTLFERNPKVQLKAVLGAGALARQVGGAQVMAEQVAHLQTMAAVNRAQIRVLGWPCGAHPAITGAFTLMKYDDPYDPDVVYVEAAVRGSYLRTPGRRGALHRHLRHDLVARHPHRGVPAVSIEIGEISPWIKA
jgi:hypothetical protein